MARVKSKKIYIFGILASRAINWYYMGPIGGGGVRGGSEFFGPPLQHFTGPLPRIFNVPPAAQAQSIGTLFEQIGLRGGSVDMSKSQRHTSSGAGRGGESN